MRHKTKSISAIFTVLFVAMGALASNGAHAWGERGHHVVCLEASRLVKEPGLKNFLKTRGELMGHVCNVPDIHWKSLPSAVSGVGNPAHYFEPDMFGISIFTTSTSLAEFMAVLAQQGDPQELIKRTGSMWWRADQLAELAAAAGAKASASALPVNSLEEQSNALPYNQNVYDLMTNMGLLGHYAGDASMPYHNTGNYDGWQNGHGGLHAYYESVCPGEYESDVNVQVRHIALRLRNYPAGAGTLEVMKHLSTSAYKEIALMERLDRVLKPSTEIVNEQGMTIRTPAERPAPEKQCPSFRPLIATEIARSAKALAHIWDQIYVKSNRPNLSAYKSYRYPLTPDFVTPDYLSQAN